MRINFSRASLTPAPILFTLAFCCYFFRLGETKSMANNESPKIIISTPVLFFADKRRQAANGIRKKIYQTRRRMNQMLRWMRTKFENDGNRMRMDWADVQWFISGNAINLTVVHSSTAELTVIENECGCLLDAIYRCGNRSHKLIAW